jgi:hypothetical protein
MSCTFSFTRIVRRFNKIRGRDVVEGSQIENENLNLRSIAISRQAKINK